MARLVSSARLVKEDKCGRTACISGCPSLAWSCIRCLSENAQRVPVCPGMRHGRQCLFKSKAHEPANHCCRSDFDENCMIKTHSVECIVLLKDSLNLVRLDHAQQNPVHVHWLGTRLRFFCFYQSAQSTGYSEDSPEIVCINEALSVLSFSVNIAFTHPTDDPIQLLQRHRYGPDTGSWHPDQTQL